MTEDDLGAFCPVATAEICTDVRGNVIRQWVSPRGSRQAIDGTIAFLKARGLSAPRVEIVAPYRPCVVP